jgi:glutamate synthase domain-containing protein 2
MDTFKSGLRESATFDRNVIHEIQRAAETGIYDIRGWGAKRRLPHFDDLVFLGASMSRYPLEGYRERCSTDVWLGTRFASKPLHLEIPVTIAGMSFGSLSANAKEALGRGATTAGTSTTTGDGGMTPEERGHSKLLVYQYLPSRYGMNPDDLRKADAIEIVLGQGAKPGGGGMLLGRKISDRVAEMRTLPKGIDQRSACRHPDWTGPDDLEIKIQELREITDWEKPIYIKVGASRTFYDVTLAVKAGADVVVVDGMQGGTGATQDVFIEHVGIPTLPAVRQAVEALNELGMHRKVQLIVSGGIRSGADVAKALAMGADAVSIGTAALIALGDNSPRHQTEYEKIGSSAGFFDRYEAGNDPAGITTQDLELQNTTRSPRRRPPLGELPQCTHDGDPDHRPRLRQIARPQPRARRPRRPHHRSRRNGRRAPGRNGLDSWEQGWFLASFP